MPARAPTPMRNVQLRLAAGGWVPVCRVNAERLHTQAHVQVQFKAFFRGSWTDMSADYQYSARMLFRARNR